MPTNLKQMPLRRLAPRTAGLLIAISIVCFGILHIIGATMLRYGPAAPPVDRPSVSAERGD